MKNGITRIKVKSYEKEDFERDESKKAKRNKLIGVDFQRIENHPISKQDHEIQRKMASSESPFTVLARKEEVARLKESLPSASLAATEIVCVELTLAGLTPPEISEHLKIVAPSVHLHLRRAVIKIKSALKNE